MDLSHRITAAIDLSVPPLAWQPLESRTACPWYGYLTPRVLPVAGEQEVLSAGANKGLAGFTCEHAGPRAGPAHPLMTSDPDGKARITSIRQW